MENAHDCLFGVVGTNWVDSAHALVNRPIELVKIVRILRLTTERGELRIADLITDLVDVQNRTVR